MMKLTYFPAYGRAEHIRFLFAHAKVEYEDIKIGRDKLKELRESGSMEFMGIQELEIDGKMHG